MTPDVTCWHFAGATLRDGRPLPKAGETLTHDGPVIPCESGFHGSVRAIDALGYAPGAMVARVRLSGTVVAHDKDKHAASARTNLTDYVDASRVLHLFACECATDALDAVEKRGGKVDPRSRAAIACKLAWLAGKATNADLDTARDTAWDTARDAARGAARGAAWGAAWATARAAAWAAAWGAARDTAWDTAWDAQNVKLETALTALLAALGGGE